MVIAVLCVGNALSLPSPSSFDISTRGIYAVMLISRTIHHQSTIWAYDISFSHIFLPRHYMFDHNVQRCLIIDIAALVNFLLW